MEGPGATAKPTAHCRRRSRAGTGIGIHWIDTYSVLEKLVEFDKLIRVEFTHIIRMLAWAFTNSSIGFNYLTLGSNQVERHHKYSLLRRISHDQICFSVSPSTTRAFSHGSAWLYLASRSTQLFYIRPGSCPIIWLVFAVGEYCEIVHQVTVATLNAKTST